MKLYSPLTGDFYEKEEDGIADLPSTVFGDELAYCEKEIKAELEKYGQENLMEYFDIRRNPGVKEKVVSAVPSVEVQNWDLIACTTLKLKSPLTDAERKDLQDYLTGQFADGWGEGFEQRQIEVDGGILCVHFWNPDSFVFEIEQLKAPGKAVENLQESRRPKMRLYGEDGNIFAILGRAAYLLRENGQSKQAKEMMDRVCHSDNYYKALRIISEYVETELTPSAVQETEHRKNAPTRSDEKGGMRLNIELPENVSIEHSGGDGWTILHGDALGILPHFRPDSFDALITDPPYASGGWSQNEKNRTTNQKYSSMSSEKALPEFIGDQKDQRSWTRWMAEWLFEAWKACKDGAPVCLFIDWRQLPCITDALQWAGWIWRGIVVWDKLSGRPQKGRFRQQSEFVVWGSKGPMPINRPVGCLPGVFHYANPQNRTHVTEKPLQLMRDLVKICEPGGRILDPFCGSGTTVLAAKMEGYEAVGIEASGAYYKLGSDRVRFALDAHEKAEESIK